MSMSLPRRLYPLAFLICALSLVVNLPAQGNPMPTELFLKGYSVVPSPRHVELKGPEVRFGEAWAVNALDLPSRHIAVRSLLDDLRTFHGLELRSGGSSGPQIQLEVRPGTVKVVNRHPEEVESQAYRLTIGADRVTVSGNGEAGLFYGVQTLLQLLKQDQKGDLWLPEGVIEDWPTLALRFLHWDTKHHQDRPETLRRFLDWTARFKANMIAFEVEDKFAYPSHPVIGAPGAFTTEEMQELVRYAAERFIQIVPDVQSPAHMAYVLKHPEFAHLKADGNNYQSCLCDEETYDLIFSMYDDVIKATPGVDYFLVSTDEVYYAGICEKCQEPFNPQNRSLKWVEFAKRARDFMHERSRTMIAWVEYPLLTEHVGMLPPDIINGVLGNDPDFIDAQNRIGMRQLVYTSMQGSEFLLPNYWREAGGDWRSSIGRLWSTFQALSEGAWRGDPIGTLGAAWGDSGLHNETFWLGWATVAQYGWTPGNPSVEQHVEDFMNTYFGPGNSEVVGIYRGLQEQTSFFQDSWDRVVSRDRDSGYGNSNGPGQGVIRRDWTLPQPALPRLPGLDFVPVYDGAYSERIDRAGVMADRAQGLVHDLYGSMARVERNRYNLEVLLSLVRLTQHHSRLLQAMASIESTLASARRSAESDQARQAVRSLVSAYKTAERIVIERKANFAALEQVWEKSRYPKGQSLGGRDFVHVLDDTKDHWADRRRDLSYMIAPEESINLEGWMEEMANLTKAYAERNGIPVQNVLIQLEPEE